MKGKQTKSQWMAKVKDQEYKTQLREKDESIAMLRSLLKTHAPHIFGSKGRLIDKRLSRSTESPAKELQDVKNLLGEEKATSHESAEITMLPILHNKDRVFLQFCGWSINLYADGTWLWEDTTGG